MRGITAQRSCVCACVRLPVRMGGAVAVCRGPQKPASLASASWLGKQRAKVAMQ